MRISTWFKNIFSDEMPEVKVVTKEELDREIKTKTVLVNPDVIAKIFKFFVSRKNVEGACLLRGRLYGGGGYLLVEDAFCCRIPDATAAQATVPVECFSKASKIDDGNFIVGLAHSHVGGVPVFMSWADSQVQEDFQALFSDSVALIMNPFADDGIDFSFYRFQDGDLKKLSFKYMVKRDENQT